MDIAERSQPYRGVRATLPGAAPLALATLALALSGLSAGARAAYRCVSPSGAVGFQDTPCPGHHRQDTVAVTAAPSASSAESIARSRRIDAAIVAGQPVVGMSRREVDRALGGAPDRVAQGQYPGVIRDQLTFERGDRIWVVTLDNGRVVGVESREPRLPRAVAAASGLAQARACPSAAEIRDIEMRINMYANRDKPQLQAELARQLREARGCR